MTKQELQKSGKWDWLKDCPLPGYDISIVSTSTKAEPAGPDEQSIAKKDALISSLSGRCKQMSKQLKEANAEIFRLRKMNHLEIAGYVKFEMLGLMAAGLAENTRMFSAAKAQFSHPIYRVRITENEPAT